MLDGDRGRIWCRPPTACTPPAVRRPGSPRTAGGDHVEAQRQHRISSLLEEHAVTSQAQLTELLEADGIGATRTAVSRDLDELGDQGRVPGGETVYDPGTQSAIALEDHLRRVMSDWVADVNHSLNLVVLRTRLRARPRPPSTVPGWPTSSVPSQATTP